MKNTRRLLYAFGIFACIYTVSLYVIPRLGFIRSLRAEWSWIGPGTITQVSFLVFSLVLMLIFSGGRLSSYGLRGVAGKPLAQAILVGLGVSAVLFLAGMIVMSLLFGPGPPSGGKHPMMSRGLVGTILSVWILASTCEEFFYRGFLQNFLSPLKAYGLTLIQWRISLPVLFGALTFGAGHLCLLGIMPDPLVGQIVVSAFFNGIIAGYFMEKTGSIIPAIAVHMTFNITGMVIPSILMRFQ